MRYLLLFALVGAAAWWFRRRWSKPAEPLASRKPWLAPTDMHVCGYCGVHVPVAESVPGKRANYCSAAHRLIAAD